MLTTRRTRLPALLASGLLAAIALSACGGGEDFANEPRPPATLSITAVIGERQVTVSPNEFGAGPILLTVSNQDSDSHRVTLAGRGDDGTRINEQTGPINPFDAATIQQELPEGDYELRASSESDFEDQIEPGRIVVGPARPSASDELELP